MMLCRLFRSLSRFLGHAMTSMMHHGMPAAPVVTHTRLRRDSLRTVSRRLRIRCGLLDLSSRSRGLLGGSLSRGGRRLGARR